MKLDKLPKLPHLPTSIRAPRPAPAPVLEEPKAKPAKRRKRSED